MSGIEFRNKSSTAGTQGYDTNQLPLPYRLAPNREVHWLHGVVERRRSFSGRRVAQLILERDIYYPKMTFIDAEKISELKDPDLRYALRFADAANAIGWTSDGPDSKSAHDVCVIAADDGVNSKFLEASYTGVTRRGSDTFLQNLHTAAPNR